jgi:hypothetical protein
MFYNKECCKIHICPLSNIFNKSLSSGIFPNALKDAKIIQILKSGVRSEVNNYRPISVLSVIAKVFEKIVFNQFYEYFSSNDLLSTNQSDFRPFHSTVTALKKAFDTVDHAFLVNMLNLFGFFGKELDWVRSYLSNRSQNALLTVYCLVLVQ